MLTQSRAPGWWHDLFDAAGDAVIGIEAAGRVCAANAVAERLFGWRERDVLDRPAAALFASPLSEIDTLAPAGRLALGERQVLDSDGRAFAVEVHLVAGGPSPCACTLLLRQPPAAEKGCERGRIQTLLDHVADVVFEIDAAGQWTRLNAAWQRVTGHAARDAVGKPAAEFLPAEDREVLHAALAPLFAGEREAATHLVRVRGRDGALRVLEARLRPVCERGRVVAVAGFAGDATQRQAEERLRDELRFIDRLVETMPNPIYIKDAAGRYIGFNLAFRAFFGRRRRDFLGKTAFDLLPHALAEWDVAHDRELRSSPGVQTLETRLPGADGNEHDVILHKASYAKADGRPAGVVGVITDISERKRAERELVAARDAAESASRVKSAFLATVSHEFRTPMNAVIGMADLLEDTPLEAQQREYLRLMRESAHALLNIINDVLDFSKLERGGLDFEQIPFSLRDCVAVSATQVEARAHAKSLRLTWSVAPSLPDELLGDPQRLRQVLGHLFDNAVKFTERGHVHLAVAAAPAGARNLSLRFCVRDTGPGIPADKQQAIFDAFVQADTSATRRHGGTGLGLALCKRLVEGMGGSLGVTSEPGRGSEFHFTLRFGTPAAAPAAMSGGKLAGLRALVVCASSAARNQFVAMFKASQAEARGVPGHRQAVAALRADAEAGRSVGLILVDSPGNDEASLGQAASLRQLAPQSRIVLLVSVGMRGDAALCREQGVSAYLVHPVDAADLREAIELSLASQATPAGELITRHTLRERRRASASDVTPPGPAALSPAPTPVDFTAAMENLGGDREIFHAVAGTFLADYAKRLEDMRTAGRGGEFRRLRELAHGMKGAIGNFGIDRASAAARTLEVAATREDIAAVTQGLADLVREVDALAAALQAEIAAGTAPR